jgi:hypothetical protein
MSLGIYVVASNEDRFIIDCLKPALGVFPDIAVIDINSTDDTADKARSLGVPVFYEKQEHPRQFPDIKNKYSDKHEKVIWIDADEIYPIPVLEKLKRDIENPGDYMGFRTAYKQVKEDEQGVWVSEEVFSAGVKAHIVSYYYYVRAYPNDSLHPREGSLHGSRKSKAAADFNYYFWHCVLMNRSSEKENTARAKKRAIRMNEFAHCNWIKLEKFPWI